ncbi:MAG: protein kinase, partial [Planctomycetota bacterium]
PHNILVGADGRARITDFGIASLSSELRRGEAISGTPTYMAPELFAGGEPSVRSELYSLGLILYELFTGKPRFAARSMTELLGQHREAPPHLSDDEADPRVADVLMACLESDPSLRPDSAFAVLGRLPGGDPLAAALAAGETPSPELVACCGGKGCLRARTAVLGVAAISIVLAVVLVLAPRVTLLGHVPLPKSEEVLADRAEEILVALGYPMEAMFGAFGFQINERLLVEIRDQDDSLDRWQRLEGPRSSAIDFWYRASPAPLLASHLGERVTWSDPPATRTGMVQLRLDPRGKLKRLLAVPRPADAGRSDTTPDWSPLFLAAGVDPKRLREAEPRDLPRVFADHRAAWSAGPAPAVPLRVEAASLGSRIVHFRVIRGESPEAAAGPVQKALLRSHLAGTEEQNPGILLERFLELGVLIGGLVLAGLNLRKGRVDHANAFRVSVAVSAMTFAWTSLRGVHSSSFLAELDLFVAALVAALFMGARFWVYYIAVEPHVRRIWPETLISWTRCVGGSHSDPLVGVSILAGLFLGLVSAVCFYVDRLTPDWVGQAPGIPFSDASFGLDAILGFGAQIGLLLASWVRALHFALSFVLALVLLKMLTGSRWIAAILYGGFVVVMWTLMGPSTIFSWGLYALTLGCCLYGLIRFGLFALSVGAFAFFLVTTYPMTLDLSSWYAGGTLLAAGTILAMAVFAARAATGSRRAEPANGRAS